MPASATLLGSWAIRVGVTLLAACAFSLSYDALQQMAVAIHIHRLLTYVFPLVIDGFIAIGIGALLMLRTAPLHSRLYVWMLVGIATATSIWANALHAVRLNQQTLPAGSGLSLDDPTVGVLSAVAPLALAGAVHLYLVIQRHLATTTPHADATTSHNSHPTQPRPEPQAPPAPTDVAPPAEAAPPVASIEPQAGETTHVSDDLLVIARTAPLGRGGRASRRHIEEAIRADGRTVGRHEADRLKDLVQAELDAPETALATAS
ncbi:DUF2637 domain-containing protein [Streptomyces sp. NPDC090306]|uniref:DUF2637 domain-containing protein n=1 Tax=Streptomyces sp. NPDC090306 TaxID=3365961 RepID=UPI003825D507